MDVTTLVTTEEIVFPMDRIRLALDVPVTVLILPTPLIAAVLDAADATIVFPTRLTTAVLDVPITVRILPIPRFTVTLDVTSAVTRTFFTFDAADVVSDVTDAR